MHIVRADRSGTAALEGDAGGDDEVQIDDVSSRIWLSGTSSANLQVQIDDVSRQLGCALGLRLVRTAVRQKLVRPPHGETTRDLLLRKSSPSPEPKATFLVTRM